MVDQVKVIEIGSDAIEAVFKDKPLMAELYPPILMQAVVAALGRHGYIIEDRYEEDVNELADSVANDPDWPPGQVPPSSPVDLAERLQMLGKTTADWEVEGDDA